jgi:hypothetical protein
VHGLEKRYWRRETELLFGARAEAEDGIKGEDEKSGGAEHAEETSVEENVGERVQMEIVAERQGIGDRSSEFGIRS